MEKFHDRLKFLREKKGMTQKDLAEKLKVTVPAVSQWELGKAKPKLYKLRQLENLFGQKLEEPKAEYIENVLSKSPSDQVSVNEKQDTRDAISDLVNKNYWYSFYTKKLVAEAKKHDLPSSVSDLITQLDNISAE